MIYDCYTLKSPQQLTEQVEQEVAVIVLDIIKKNKLNKIIKKIDLIVKWLDFASTILLSN